MPRYTSRTGKDIILRFEGNVITVPAHGFFETTGEDLEYLFPDKIRKVEPDVVLFETEPPQVHIEEVITPNVEPIQYPVEKENPSIEFPGPLAKFVPVEAEIPKVISMEVPIPTQVTAPNIQEIDSPILKEIILNPPIELSLPPVKEITKKEEIIQKIAETINNGRNTYDDLDVEEFLQMIREIISEK
jgi:hypothetical protein